MTSLEANDITKDTGLLLVTRQLLQKINGLLENERPPRGPRLTYLIQSINAMSLGRRNRLKADIVSTTVARETLRPSPPYPYHHTHRMVSPTLAFPQGTIQCGFCAGSSRRHTIKLSQQDVLPIIFPPGKPAELNVKITVYDELLNRLQAQAGEEEIDMKKGTVPELSMFTPNPSYSHTISNTPKLIHTTILVDRNSLVTDVAPFSAASILLPNLLVFLNSSPKFATTKSIYGGLAIPCCHRSNGCDYDPQSRLSIPRLERE